MTLKSFEKLLKRYRLKKIKHVVAGGARRCDSVNAGLKVLDGDTQSVVVHDGASSLGGQTFAAGGGAGMDHRAVITPFP